MKKEDKKFIANTYNRYDLLIDNGKGAVCTDDKGVKYIDFTSGIGVNSLGFCDDEWLAAVNIQINKLQHTSNLYYTKPQIETAELLCKNSFAEKVFFANSGAEANECAIKIARKYSYDKYGAGRSEIITLVNSFHGRTMATLSATGQEVFHDYFFPFVEGFRYSEANNFEDFISKIDNTICAVMLELVQGEGGVIALDREYVKCVSNYCIENDILLIIDEVQTGIGRTGKLFAYEHYNILPDIVTSAKGLGGGLPIGACLLGKKVENVLGYSHHGTTFGGNPVICAGAKVVINRICNEKFLREITEKANYIKTKLSYIDEVEEITGLGLMIGLKLRTKTAKDVLLSCLDKGLMVLTAKDRIRLLPPLNIERKQLETGIDILIYALTE